MSFVALGSMELILLLALSGGGTGNDPVMWMDPQLYFQSREIKLEAAAMVEQAGKDPKDPQAGVAQLLAIRWLGENAAETKQARGARELLEQIAAGQKAQDKLGFSRDYAKRALAQLDGKQPERERLPDNSVKSEALAWFPPESTLVGAVDFRATGEGGAVADVERMRASLMKFVPLEQLGQSYDFVDKVGNIRLDRAAFGLIWDNQNNKNSAFLFRFTGKIDGQRLVKYLSGQEFLQAKATEEKGPNGEPITLVSFFEEKPDLAIIGTSEVLMVARPHGRPGSDVLRQMLDIRAGKKPGFATGMLAGRLKDVPAQASAVLAGDIPEDGRREMGRELPFAVPKSILVDLTRGKTMAVRVTATQADADEAKKTTDTLISLKQVGLEKLKEVPAEIAKPAQIALFRKTLEGVKLEADGASVKASAEIGTDVLRAVQELMETVLARDFQR
jgi:hypothetical protein